MKFLWSIYQSFHLIIWYLQCSKTTKISEVQNIFKHHESSLYVIYTGVLMVTVTLIDWLDISIYHQYFALLAFWYIDTKFSVIGNKSPIKPQITFAIKYNKNLKVIPLFIPLFLTCYIKYRIVAISMPSSNFFFKNQFINFRISCFITNYHHLSVNCSFI